MSIDITMPALSPTMEEGILAKWLVNEGDTVSAGDIIAEIETDKATMEVEAVDEGIVAKLMVAAGTEGVKVNAVIAVLAEDGEDASTVGAAPKAKAPPKAEEIDQTAPVVSQDHATMKSDKITKGDKSDKSDRGDKGEEGDRGDRVFATPVARRIASQAGLEISSIIGSGPRGRVIKNDIEAAIETGSGVQIAALSPETVIPQTGHPQTGHPQTGAVAGLSASGPAPMLDQQILSLFEDGSYEKKPHDGMRRVIAERLSQSNATVPSYTVTMECNLDAMLSLRAQMNGAAPMDKDGKPAYRISVNDFIIKAMALALQAVPLANSSWTSTDRILHKHSHVGVAVAVDDGLFTPIIRKAELKTLSAISAEVKDMAGRARNKKLKPEEYQGGCTAVSNLGMFGVREFTSIINPPHASIVSIGAGEKRAVVNEQGALAVATMMMATFAFDHRCIDGALGAELAAAFTGYIENPMGMLV